MNSFLERLSGNSRDENGAWLPENRKRVVIARDFVGYDLSAQVPNENGSLELASIASDQAVYEWAVDQYPGVEIILVGRSVGTMGWANLLPFSGCYQGNRDRTIRESSRDRPISEYRSAFGMRYRPFSI